MADNRLGPTSAGAGTSHLGTITADLLEEERAGFIYNNDQEMLEANAVLEAEAEDREKLETLQHQLKTKRSRMKMLQECIAPTRPPRPSQRSPQRPRSPRDEGVHIALVRVVCPAESERVAFCYFLRRRSSPRPRHSPTASA